MMIQLRTSMTVKLSDGTDFKLNEGRKVNYSARRVEKDGRRALEHTFHALVLGETAGHVEVLPEDQNPVWL